MGGTHPEDSQAPSEVDADQDLRPTHGSRRPSGSSRLAVLVLCWAPSLVMSIAGSATGEPVGCCRRLTLKGANLVPI